MEYHASFDAKSYDARQFYYVHSSSTVPETHVIKLITFTDHVTITCICACMDQISGTVKQMPRA